MPHPTFPTTLSITHIGTATSILTINKTIHILTDPFFSPANTEFQFSPTDVLKNTTSPALTMDQLPPISAILLSHEDHWDNLDDLGRTLLNGRHVFTTLDGANNLAPRPGVRGLKPWESVDVLLEGKPFTVTATPATHLPGGEVIGFILSSPLFRTTNSKPNVIFFSGDTIYTPDTPSGELAQIAERYHVVVALLNLGKATIPLPDGPLQITMDGIQGARLVRDIGAEVVVPMHFEGWGHFAEGRKGVEGDFEREGVELAGRVRWLVVGEETTIL